MADRHSARDFRLQCVIAAALFGGALLLYTRHNDFPFYYHPDEPGKVAQIVRGTRNFHHPLLLLTATDASTRLSQSALNCQEIVELGRTWSAIFAATAVAAFSWLGFNRFGLLGGIVGGGIVLLQRRLYELAHFMKEDTALLAGFALTFVALDAYAERRTATRALFVGTAAGLALSSKYIGLLALVPLLIVLVGSRSAAANWLACFVAMLLVSLACNYPALLSPSSLTAGFASEIARLNSRGGAVEIGFSRLAWLRWFLEAGPVLLALFAGQLVSALARPSRHRLPDLLLTLFPFVVGLVLSFSSKQSGRHLLPATVTVAFLGAMFALRLRQQRAPFTRWIAPSLLVVASGYDVARTALLDRGFQRDHRRALVEWMRTSVPPDAIVVVENRVGIPDGRRYSACDVPPAVPQQLRSAAFAGDLGSLDELRSQGVTHVAMNAPEVNIFVDDEAKVKPAPAGTFLRQRDFYRRLFAEAQLVWSRQPGNVGVLNPGLRVYQIATPVSARLP